MRFDVANIYNTNYMFSFPHPQAPFRYAWMGVACCNLLLRPQSDLRLPKLC